MHRVLCALGMENKKVVFIQSERKRVRAWDTNRCPFGWSSWLWYEEHWGGRVSEHHYSHGAFPSLCF